MERDRGVAAADRPCPQGHFASYKVTTETAA